MTLSFLFLFSISLSLVYAQGFTQRRAYAPDIANTWNLVENAGLSYECPSKIEHTTWSRVQPSGPITIPHNTIIQDGNRCSSVGTARSMEIYESKEYTTTNLIPIGEAPEMPEGMKNVLRTSGVNVNIRYAGDVAGENFLIGYEPRSRFCGTGPSVVPNASIAFVFRPFTSFEIRDVNTVMYPGAAYMLLVPKFRGSVCVYSNVIPPPQPGDEDDENAEPSSEPDNITESETPLPASSSAPAPSPASSDVPGAVPPPTLPVTSTPTSTTETDESDDDDEDTDDDTNAAESTESSDDDEQTDANATTEIENSENVCFPPHAMVTLRSGEKKRMDSITVGDEVSIGQGKYSSIYGFSHADKNKAAKFVKLTTESGNSITATLGHYILINKKERLTKMEDIHLDDELILEDGYVSKVIQIESFVLKGVFNPQTESGTLAVDGIMATTWTRSVDPSFAHAALLPFRAIHNLFKYDTLNHVLNIGLRSFVQLAPKL